MQNNTTGYSMDRFLFFSIGCLIVTAIFIHIHIIKTRKQYNIHIANQVDWMKTISNDVDDIHDRLIAAYRQHQDNLEEIKKLIESITPKNTEIPEPKIHRDNNWDSMKKAFCIPGTQVVLDE